jgi:hypothetical protein
MPRPSALATSYQSPLKYVRVPEVLGAGRGEYERIRGELAETKRYPQFKLLTPVLRRWWIPINRQPAAKDR